MSPSFKRIDYSLRPAKHAERRMLCDIFRRLTPFGRIEEYVYVGFGSVWFSDFALFHRSLGIKDMVSIEQVETAQERIDDNKPFRILVDYRSASKALLDLDWTRNQFLWLDYDDPLSPNMLLDMRTITQRAGSGTVLTVSVQCTQARQIADAHADFAVDKTTPLSRFISAFDRQRVPPATAEDQLYGWQFGALSRAMVLQEIEAELAVRNQTSPDTEMTFQPICEIEYEDGAKMTTVVGIFCSPNDLALLEECNFETLDFLPPEPHPIRISVPKLTIREFKKLESQLPLAPGSELQLGSIPISEARNFSTMYRYFPNFAVLE
jgi:hypothetical protein